MLQSNNQEDKLTPFLKQVASFSAGSLFSAGFVLLLDYALIEYRYSEYYDPWDKLLFAHFILEFCFAVIAFALMSIENIS